MVNFHFSPETPDEEYLASVQILNRLPAEAFSSLVTLGYDHLAAETTVELAETIGTLSQQHSIKPTILQSTLVSFLVFLTGCTKYNLSSEQMKEDLSELGISEERIPEILEKWAARTDDLYDVAVNQTLRVNELVDMEWSFGVVSSCKEVKKLGSTFLRVKFVFNKGGKTQTVYMEMTLPQFYEFIHELEKARANLASTK
jgi:COMM domain containing 7